MNQIGIHITATVGTAVIHGHCDPFTRHFCQPCKGKQFFHFRTKRTFFQCLFQRFILFQQSISFCLHLIQCHNGFRQTLVFRRHSLLFYRICLHPDDDTQNHTGDRQRSGIMFFYHKLPHVKYLNTTVPFGLSSSPRSSVPLSSSGMVFMISAI